MKENILEPNDVIVVLRPQIIDDQWTGGFTVMVSGIGPFTLQPDEASNMIGLGILLASVVPLIESDNEISDKIMTYCNENYSEFGVFEHDISDVNDTTAISINTKCVGGIQ